MSSLRKLVLLTVVGLLTPSALLYAYLYVFSDPVTPLVRDRMDEFVRAIEQEIARNDPACVYLGPFPLRPDLRYQASGERGCDECAALEAAGFIRFDARGRSGAYRLQPGAQPYYTSARDPRAPPVSSAPMPRFCFGHTVAYEIVEALPPLSQGNLLAVSVKYIAEVRAPAPFLFSAEARALGLPLPAQRKGSDGPWLLPPRIVTFLVDRDGTVIQTDPGLRYGKWALRG